MSSILCGYIGIGFRGASVAALLGEDEVECGCRWWWWCCDDIDDCGDAVKLWLDVDVIVEALEAAAAAAAADNAELRCPE